MVRVLTTRWGIGRHHLQQHRIDNVDRRIGLARIDQVVRQSVRLREDTQCHVPPMLSPGGGDFSGKAVVYRQVPVIQQKADLSCGRRIGACLGGNAGFILCKW